MKTFGKIMKWFLIICAIFVVVAAAVAATVYFAQKAKIEAQISAMTVGSSTTSTLVEAPVIEPKITDVVVKKFSDLGEFYIDGDPKVAGWKSQGAEMSYVCTQGYGVFISMDPGTVDGQSTGELGAVFHVVCPVGGTVTLQTPYWSTSALHNQIHLVELTQELPKDKLVDVLKIFKVDEGKQLAVFIDGTEITKY